MALQLVGGEGPCAGRLEVYHRGSWGTVCDDSWDLADAQVVCRQLQCGTALTATAPGSFGQGEGPIWLDEVRCEGNESSLWDCPARPWEQHDCSHKEDVAIVCSDRLRLSGGPSNCSGQVEVLFMGAWGSVCDDSWDLRDAQVVCRQLGCGEAESTVGGAAWGEGNGTVWLDEVNCRGSELHLWDCEHPALGQSDCQHKEDAGVNCASYTDFRLVNGPDRCSGRLEMKYGGQWGTVCDRGWDLRDATVLCQQLQCGHAEAVLGPDRFGQGNGSVFTDVFDCEGTETALGQALRVVGGEGPCAGRLEVYHSGSWGTVCDDSWDLADAQVVCRQLQCGTALTATALGFFGQVEGPIWLDEVRCEGNESSLWDCPARPWGQHDCSHKEDVAIMCSDRLRLYGGHSNCSGRVEVLFWGTWGSVCDDSWDLRDAQVVCRQLGCGEAESAVGGAAWGEGNSTVWLDEVNCRGSELHLWDCEHPALGQSDCQHKEDAGVNCASYTDFRLVNGPDRCSGRVEMKYGGQWGTVCDRGWDLRDATVLCQQLQCGRAEAVLGPDRFGQGNGSEFTDVFDCEGTETALGQCPISPRTHSTCTNRSDLGVICSKTDRLRLSGGPSNCSGQVEVLFRGVWGSVCDDSWDLRDAQVVCRQLCSGAESAVGGAAWGEGSGTVWLDEVNCRGSELHLWDCEHLAPGLSHCQSQRRAAVRCAGARPSHCILTASPDRLRLSRGPSNCSGRVEVLFRGTWGSVCTDSWDLRDTQVVCRQLGCGEAESAVGEVPWGEGNSTVRLDEVNCRGSELHLWDCEHPAPGLSRCQSQRRAAVCCAEHRALRLVGGEGPCVGRLEVYHSGSWGTVCDDSWDLADARVVCRQLQCGTAITITAPDSFGQGEGHIWLDEVRCEGNESSLWDCPSRPWGQHDCRHKEDVAIICSDRLRLSGGPSNCSGRVEVLFWGAWGSVCDDSWDLRDAQVVCRQLRCGEAESAVGGAAWGEGNGTVWLDEVNCRGSELHLWDCEHPALGQSDCQHKEDAGVNCANMQNIHLSRGPSNCSGWVEVLFRGVWGSVCDDSWDLRDAQVVCRQLGCGEAESTVGGAAWGEGSGTVWLDEVNCRGSELHLWDCEHPAPGLSHCQSQRRAAVRCAGSLLSEELSYDDVGAEVSAAAGYTDFRLVNGPDRCSGRLEMKYGGQWGTVCDRDWDLRDATVLCQQLQCGHAEAVLGPDRFGQGNGSVFTDVFDCEGIETALGQCPISPWTHSTCTNRSDLGVICSKHRALRLVGGEGPCVGRLEVYHSGSWGTVCDDSWDLADARVVCRQLQCGTAITITAPDSFGQGEGHIWLDEVRCEGNESSLWDCPSRPWGQHDCRHKEDVAIICSDRLRLSGGPSNCSGRVEVLFWGAWGSVCDDSWDLRDAQVVCRQLRCGEAESAVGGAAWGEGNGTVWLDEVNCRGSELHLWDCEHPALGQSDCQHKEDAGVNCASYTDFRLVNGPDRCSGRVEMKYGGQWGTVCDRGWDLRDATVLFQQLQCGHAEAVLGPDRFGQGNESVFTDVFDCEGTETALGQCPISPWTHSTCTNRSDLGVVCSSCQNLRLVDGGHRCNGRVEVFQNGQWGTVCVTEWGTNNGQVVCDQLNCGTYVSAYYFPAKSGPILLSGVKCRGTESVIPDCKSDPQVSTSCTHDKDLGVACSEHRALRLVGAEGPCAGRLEVHHSGSWGTVCDDSWDLADVQVVCRQLQCGTAITTTAPDSFGQGEGPIWLDEVHCEGNESSLWDCPSRPWGKHDCIHKEDVAIMCSETDRLRLSGGPSNCSGRVEVLFRGTWGSVCDDSWDLIDAQVVCRQLGCGEAVNPMQEGTWREWNGTAWLDKVNCRGSEQQLWDCEHTVPGPGHCRHTGVTCTRERVRLSGGPSNCSGRVEVLFRGVWGSVCDDSWDLRDAQVVCRQLGCGEAESAVERAAWGEGNGTVWLDEVNCRGSELHLWDCEHPALGQSDCQHKEDAGVNCAKHRALQLVGGEGPCAGRLEVYHRGSWGKVCKDSWDLADAQVVCQHLQCGKAITTTALGSFGQGEGPIWLNEVRCEGNESSLWDCPSRPWGQHDCRHKEDVAVMCSGTRATLTKHKEN
ncbi:DMBT1 protein, partial [Amia calva]|nr:DMBT1 protein [Amia calva]